MKNVVIAMYEKNAEEAAKVCRNHDIFAFIDEESLDDYIERLKRGIAEDSYILTDEEGGAPFLAALIVSADTADRRNPAIQVVHFIGRIRNHAIHGEGICLELDIRIGNLHIRDDFR